MNQMLMNKLTVNRSLYAGIMAATVLAASVLLSSCGGEKKDDPKEAKAPVVDTTLTFTLQKGKLSSDLKVPGELDAFQQVDLYAKVSSFVQKLYVDVGSEVHEGEVLAVMEAPELNSQLEAAKSRIESMNALYLASKSNYDKMYQTSLTPGTIAQNDLDQAEARKNSDLANLEAAKSTYKEVEDTKNYLVMKAPFSGVISVRNVNPGAFVGPAGTGSAQPMFVLQQQNLLRLEISVPEVYTAYVNSSGHVNFTVKALPSEKFTAQVKRLAGAIDNRLRSQHIEMDVHNDDKKLLPGMVAEVTVPLPGQDSTLIIPKSALINSMLGLFVIKVEGGKAQWVKVRTGRDANNFIEVYGDLKAGDELVWSASEEIRDGSSLAATRQVPAEGAVTAAK
jgi:membrane fusion protein (multidrug efflux system)